MTWWWKYHETRAKILRVLRGGLTEHCVSPQMNLASKSYRMLVEAHLDVEIDGHPAQLNGRGDQLQLILESEETLYSLLNSYTGASQLADVLADLGLTVIVIDEQQPLLKIGHDASSRLIRVITGSRHIAPANLPSLIKLFRGYLSGRRE